MDTTVLAGASGGTVSASATRTATTPADPPRTRDVRRSLTVGRGSNREHGLRALLRECPPVTAAVTLVRHSAATHSSVPSVNS